MKFAFIVEIEVERNEGKFASHVEIAGLLQEALEDADLGSFDCENGGEYSTTSWDVREDDTPR
jgi:hypothetical protein